MDRLNTVLLMLGAWNVLDTYQFLTETTSKGGKWDALQRSWRSYIHQPHRYSCTETIQKSSESRSKNEPKLKKLKFPDGTEAILAEAYNYNKYYTTHTRDTTVFWIIKNKCKCVWMQFLAKFFLNIFIFVYI